MSEKNSEVSNVDADSNLSAKVINLVTPNESISINDQAEIFKFVSADTGDVNNFVINDLSSEVNLDEALEKFDLSDLLQVENSGSNDPLSSYLKVSSDGSDTKISVDANSNGQTDSEITLKGVDLMGLYGSEDIIKSLFDQTTTKDF
ncbi:type I secretion C-terminal target domain-containing protein [Psychrosphaera haliotis]|uniref:Type I secretion C-terminal target domain-containing protein n=1 Tax=Psychrosphaera haliotis TaxID=555083 RepID=A0A6N8F945_9GAMM|nr:type I secretion C-terminal target domain-containing protein [Psychrosphaera haliotis]MUH71430.1 type I secretion C-terminal target domain-containing protein [Psychrosphaera haliotis]